MNLNLLEFFNELPKIRQILPNQMAIIDYILKHIDESNNGILLYSKPGTGKTLIGIITSLILSNTKKLLLLMPSENILTLWKNTIGLALTLIDDKYNLNNIELTSIHAFMFKITNENELIENVADEYKNYIIIIDEAHNILNNSQFDKLIEIKKRNNNVFILLTGSPINNTVETLPNLLNLITYDLVIDLNLIVTNQKVFEIKFNESKLEYIEQLCYNNVSYYETPKNLLPKIDYQGELCGLNFKCIVCPMTKEHFSIFMEARKITKNEVFEKTLMNVSLFGIENLYITEDIERLRIKEYRKGLFFNGSQFIGKELDKLNYAPKFKILLENLKLFGKHFIYFSNASYGSLIIRSIMNHYGYVEYKLNKSVKMSNEMICYKCYTSRKCKECIPAAYIILTGYNILQINDYLNVYNKSNNKDGSVIKIIFGSNVLSEAYTLKETLHTHYLTVPDNYRQVEQINGRTIRKFSFENIDVLVKIFIYLAVEPNYKESDIIKCKTYNDFIKNIDNIISYDLKKLLYIELKNYETHKILNVFKDSSVSYNKSGHSMLNDIIILNKLKEMFYKNTRIKIHDFFQTYDSNILSLNKKEFEAHAISIIENHPSIINKYFKLCLLYKYNDEIITVPFHCDYGTIYFSFYMKKEISNIDITKKKNDIYIVIDRETLISYDNSLINIKSLTMENLISICDRLKIELVEFKKYYKMDLIKIIIDHLYSMNKKNPNVIYVIKH